MSFVRLRAFLIVSSVMHIIAIFMVAVFFHLEGTVTKPKLIGIGVINEYRDPEGGSGRFLKEAQHPGESLPLNEWPNLEGSVESRPTRAPKPEKRVVKNVNEGQLGEMSKKEEELNRTGELVDEKDTTQPGQNSGEDKRANEIASNTAAGIRSSTGAGFSEGIGTEGSTFSEKGSGQGGEQTGYPDYKINPKPRYPIIARRSGYEGIVLLRVWVMGSGKVGEIELERSSGYEVLDKSAIEAVKNWIFIPGKRNGVSISSWVTVPIRFQLSSG